jgi:2-polyprenyl-3-methyl-5-hydroxy-6-metoxy-1,4-benzoquinol methylase
MARRPDGDYWNHNTAYHPWLIKIATRHRGDVLDVGCGDGLLAQRLVPVSRSVTAIDPDATVIDRAVERLRTHPNVTVERIDFRTYEPAEHTFDVITFVASLHHMDLRTALTKARNLLRPGGEIAVVGLSANKTVRDWMWALSCVLGARIGSRLNSETRDIGVAVADPRECLDDIRRAADEILPGASIRRALYYRYLLRWANA